MRLILSTPNVDPNLMDGDGKSALALSVIKDRLEAVQVLASAPGVDMNLGCPASEASADYFCHNFEPFEPGHKSKIREILLSHPDTDTTFLCLL